MNRRKFFRFLPALPVLGIAAVETARAATLTKEEPNKIAPTVKLPPVRMPAQGEHCDLHLNGLLLRPGFKNDYMVERDGIRFEWRLKKGDWILFQKRLIELDHNYAQGSLIPYSLFP